MTLSLPAPRGGAGRARSSPPPSLTRGRESSVPRSPPVDTSVPAVSLSEGICLQSPLPPQLVTMASCPSLTDLQKHDPSHHLTAPATGNPTHTNSCVPPERAHVCTHMHTHSQAHTCAPICMLIHMHTCVDTYMFTCTLIHMHTHSRARSFTCTFIHISTHTLSHSHPPSAQYQDSKSSSKTNPIIHSDHQPSPALPEDEHLCALVTVAAGFRSEKRFCPFPFHVSSSRGAAPRAGRGQRSRTHIPFI